MGIPQQIKSENTEIAELNGIDLTTFSKVPEMLAEAPEQAILTFETRTRWAGGMRTRSQSSSELGGQPLDRSHVAIESDEPVQLCGTDKAPSPQELLLSAVGSCLTTVYSIQATMMGIELRSVEVEMRGTFDLRGSLELADVPKGFPEVSCRVRVAANAAPDQIQELHERALRTSPNYYNLTHAIPSRAQLVITD